MTLKKLGFFGALSLVVGNIIGIGIFTTTGYMASFIQSSPLILLAWVVGAIYAWSGAVVYGMLSGAYPLSGGDYQYLSRMVHPFTGYLFGWSAFFVTYSGSVAALAIASAFYLDGTLLFVDFNTVLLKAGGLELTWIKLVAILAILLFTWINYRGIILSGKFQITLTGGIILLLIGFALAGSLSSEMDPARLTVETGAPVQLSGFLTALIAVLFSYMGWTTAVYVAEEIDDARKILPRALLTGVVLVAVIYLWINLVYLMNLSVTDMQGVVNIGSLIAVHLWGGSGQIIVSMLILVAVLSSLNSTILSGPRIYMAMGRDGFLLGKTEKLHPRYQVPHIALIWQGIWSIILVLSGSFNQLLSFVVFVVVIFSIIAGILGLRIGLAAKNTSGWQLFGAVFYIVFCFVILVNTLWQQMMESLIGLGIVILAVPSYYFEQKRKSRLNN